MNAPIISFFNNKSGGATTLVYHLAWMYNDLGLKVLVADLDPQSNLTVLFLDEDRIEEILSEEDKPNTIFRALTPLLSGLGDVIQPHLEKIDEGLELLVGDLKLYHFEDELAYGWMDCLNQKQRGFRVVSSFWRVLTQAASINDADVVLVDLGPSLGAINRAALVASDYVIFPLSPDIFSLQGLKNIGPTVRRWREEWQERIPKNPASDLDLPKGKMQPVGYVILQHGVRFDRPVKAFQKWIERIPYIYNTEVIQNQDEVLSTQLIDPNRLALLKHYQSLMPMAQESHKPIFHLKPADGAIGAHIYAVRDVYRDFKKLAEKIASQTELVLPNSHTKS